MNVSPSISVAALKGLPRRTLRRVDDAAFQASLVEALGSSHRAKLADIVALVKASTGLSEVSVRQRIARTPGFETESIGEGHKKDLIRTTTGAQVGAEPRKGHMEMVLDEVMSVLQGQPNEEIRLNDLYKIVSEAVPCQRPTFYQVVDKATGIRKFKTGRVTYVIFDHLERVQRIEPDLKKHGIESRLATELARPLRMLTVDDVDLALFELGQIFETTLKSYLLAAGGAGVVRVSAKDTKTLQNMIDCAVREEVVKKGHAMHLLRDERNTSAHERATPSERVNLFNRAHYLADLYLEHIAALDKLHRELPAPGGSP